MYNKWKNCFFRLIKKVSNLKEIKNKNRIFWINKKLENSS